MKTEQDLPVGLLRRLFRLNPETGDLIWRSRPASLFSDGGFGGPEASAASWNAKNAGEAAFTKMTNGYRGGKVLGVDVYAHQVVFALTHGRWPIGPIDHDNGNRLDNRPLNLVEATVALNNKNRCLDRRNKSGTPGVYWHKAAGKWAACIKADGRKEHLGLFADLDAAVAARKAAELRLGFHPNHGRDQTGTMEASA